MSRLIATVTATGNFVAYGLDYMGCGWFYQEYDKDDNTVVDIDSSGPIGGLSRGKLVELLELTNAPHEHKMRIAMDIDPAG